MENDRRRGLGLGSGERNGVRDGREREREGEKQIEGKPFYFGILDDFFFSRIIRKLKFE